MPPNGSRFTDIQNFIREQGARRVAEQANPTQPATPAQAPAQQPSLSQILGAQPRAPQQPSAPQAQTQTQAVGAEKPRVMAPSALLRQSQGLERVARQAGLEKDVERITTGRQEDPERIFSGGFITDVFDVLNTLDYGVVGVLQGKGFSEGVRTRASFTKEEKLKQLGVPGLITGIALDIAVDPLTYVAPWTVIGKVAKFTKLEKPVKEVAERFAGTNAGKFLGSRFIYRFGQDPLYRAIDERRIRNTGVAVQNAVDLARPIAKLDPVVQRSLLTKTEKGAVVRRSLTDLKKVLPPETYKSVREAWSEIDRLGSELVKLKVIPRELYQNNIGEYVRNVYRVFEEPKVAGEAAMKGVFPAKPMRLDLAFLKKRKDLPEDVRDALGQVLEAGYPTADTLVRLSRAVEDARFFTEVNKKFAKNADEFVAPGVLKTSVKNVKRQAAKNAIEFGYEQLPTTARLGALSGKFVPKPIADSVNELIRTYTPAQKLAGRLVAGFKYNKVILNPATHARNIMSNLILNSFEGMNPLDPRAMKAYGMAAKELAKPGRWYKEAKQVGLGMDSFAAQEIRDFLKAPEVTRLGGKVQKAFDKIAEYYQKEEEFAKLAQYIFQRETRGLSPEEAWKVAERATFNYAQVTPFIRQLRESLFGFPFITFTYKATPQILRTAATKPTRISNIGKIKNAIENQTDVEELKAERASQPPWVRDGFYIKLPIEDKFGRSAYLDLTYVLPFGDLVSGKFFERAEERQTGLPESLPSAALRKSPFLNLIREMATNKDFYGNKIWRASDPIEKQTLDIFRHLSQTYLPPELSNQIPGGWRADGTRRPPAAQRVQEQEKKLGAIEQGGAQSRSFAQELMRLAGIKISPVDLAVQQEFSERSKKKALETLLEERGILKKAQIPFIPKGE